MIATNSTMKHERCNVKAHVIGMWLFQPLLITVSG